MGILDKLLGRGKNKSDYRPLSGKIETQSTEQQDATRSRMEGEMQTGRNERADREAAKE